MEQRIYTKEDIYKIYLQTKTLATGRGSRFPKDINKHFAEKMNPIYVSILDEVALYFSTKWNRIDVVKYFECGFEIFGKGFAYHKFIDERVLKLYIVKDKNEKLKLKNSKDEIMRDVENILDFMKTKAQTDRYGLFEWYCKQGDGQRKYVIEHYLTNKISPIMFIYFLYKKYIILTEADTISLPFINQQYNDVIRGDDVNKKMIALLEKADEKLFTIQGE